MEVERPSKRSRVEMDHGRHPLEGRDMLPNGMCRVFVKPSETAKMEEQCRFVNFCAENWAPYRDRVTQVSHGKIVPHMDDMMRDTNVQRAFDYYEQHDEVWREFLVPSVWGSIDSFN